MTGNMNTFKWTLCFQIQLNFLGRCFKETSKGVDEDDLWAIYMNVQLQITCDSEETRIKLNIQQQGDG